MLLKKKKKKKGEKKEKKKGVKQISRLEWRVRETKILDQKLSKKQFSCQNRTCYLTKYFLWKSISSDSNEWFSSRVLEKSPVFGHQSVLHRVAKVKARSRNEGSYFYSIFFYRFILLYSVFCGIQRRMMKKKKRRVRKRRRLSRKKLRVFPSRVWLSSYRILPFALIDKWFLKITRSKRSRGREQDYSLLREEIKMKPKTLLMRERDTRLNTLPVFDTVSNCVFLSLLFLYVSVCLLNTLHSLMDIESSNSRWILCPKSSEEGTWMEQRLPSKLTSERDSWI